MLKLKAFFFFRFSDLNRPDDKVYNDIGGKRKNRRKDAIDHIGLMIECLKIIISKGHSTSEKIYGSWTSYV